MTEVINVRFKDKGKMYYFDPAGIIVQAGQAVIVETAKGLEFGECTLGNHSVDDARIVQPLRPVIRIATEEDKTAMEQNRKKEEAAFKTCQQKILEHGLDMKLVDVEYNFEGSKILFFFTSDGRVDFRELVKDLASIFRTRIELRQIGVRDEAKMIGGLGICGKPFCCAAFLDDFQPVSIKMAKTQSLSLNPTKISGTCGRLMCCLKYEQEAYEDLIKNTPKVSSEVETPVGKGTVLEVNLLRQTVKVRLDDQFDSTLRVFKVSELGEGAMARRAEEQRRKLEVPHFEEERLKSLYSVDKPKQNTKQQSEKEIISAEISAEQDKRRDKKRRRRSGAVVVKPEKPPIEKLPTEKPKPVKTNPVKTENDRGALANKESHIRKRRRSRKKNPGGGSNENKSE